MSEDPHESIRPPLMGEDNGEFDTSRPTEDSLPTMSFRFEEDGEAGHGQKIVGNRGSFLLSEVIGRGAEGVVWSAMQVSLDRIVAVKTFNPENRVEGDTEESRKISVSRRFYAEALITARLEHPNIVPLHEIGFDDDGFPMLAMKRVRGRPWSEILKEDFKRLAVDEFLLEHLPIFMAMMQAVAFAHSRGIIHRDLKPSQVMVGEFGEVVLLDWGIALLEKDADQKYREMEDLPPALTRLPIVGDAPNPAGTPALMAPEQTYASSKYITALTDVYLLGGILYYLLTGKYPHDGNNSSQSMIKAAAGVIINPRERNPGREMPEELVALAINAMEKDPQSRISSVREFITAIRDYQTGANGKRTSTRLTEDVGRRLERLAEIGLTFSGNIGEPPRLDMTGRGINLDRLYIQLEEIRVELEKAIAAWGKNPAIPELSEKVLLASAVVAESTGDIRVARHLAGRISTDSLRTKFLDRISDLEKHRNRRDRIRRLSILSVAVLLVIIVSGTYAFLKNQYTINTQLQAERDLAGLLRDEALEQQAEAVAARAIAMEARELFEREAYIAKMNLADFALRDGNTRRVHRFLMETAGYERRHWEWGRLLSAINNDTMKLMVSSDPVNGLSGCYSSCGSLIYIGDNEGYIYVYDAETGLHIRNGKFHDSGVWHLHVSADNSMLLATSFDKTASLIDTESFQLLHRLEGHTDVLRGGSISPDGRHAATTARDSTVRIWDTSTGREVMQLPNVEAITYQATYSPDGTLLAVAQRRILTLHDAATGELVAPPKEEPGNILDFAFSPDGTMLAAACTDRFTRIYTLPDLEPVAELHQEISWLHSVDWSHDGRFIVTSGNETDIRLWDTSDWSLIETLRGTPRIYHVRFSPVANEFLSISPGAAQIWQQGSLPSRLGIYTVEPIRSSISARPDRISIARSSPLELDRAWSREFDRVFHEKETNGRTLFQHRGSTLAVDSYYRAIEPNGSRAINIVVPSLETTLINQTTGEVIRDWEGGALFAARWSPTGSHLATISVKGDFRLYDGQTLEFVAELGQPSPVEATRSARFIGVIGFDTTSQRVYTARRDGDIHIWSTVDGSLIHHVASSEPGIFAATFSHDGTLFAAGGLNGRVYVWNTETWELVSVLRGHSEYILDIDITRDNQRVLTAAHDSQVKLWETESGREVQTVFSFPDERIILGTGFMADDKVVFCIASDGNVYITEAHDWTVTGDPMAIQQAAELEKRRRRTNIDLNPAQVNLNPAALRNTGN
ncbi:MAG: protein kinase [Candidatus Sumerlaeia bacterium]|nr:protein kinase [Candidatus Sumerlaeia bacterium]